MPEFGRSANADRCPDRRPSVFFWIHWLAILLANSASAQELTPRTYWPAPKDTQLLIVGFGYQTGDIVSDPSLPIVGVDSSIRSSVLAYQRTLDLFDRTSNFQIELPYVSGSTLGELDGVPGRRDVQGFGDLAATLSINLLGAPSMSVEEFQAFRADPHTIVAASVKVVAPTGQYDDDRVINIGTNRWATRVRLGVVHPLSRQWILEVSAGTWFFEDNDEFVGSTREQDPITAFETSLIRRIRPGLWASLDANYYIGGETTIDGTDRSDFQRNSRIGFSFAYPFKGAHAIKLTYSNGLETESGGDYDSFGLTYVYRLP